MNDLRARLRQWQDRDIRQALGQLEPLDQGELSDMVREGMRKVLKERGVLGNDRYSGHLQDPQKGHS